MSCLQREIRSRIRRNERIVNSGLLINDGEKSRLLCRVPGAEPQPHA